MKKITSFLLGMILSSQFALATGADGLKQAIDEYHYSMTVEWDQVDQTFAQEQELKFHNTIEKLIENGLTVTQLKMAFKENSQFDADQVIAEINEHNITDSLEVQKYIQQKLQSNYARGASWVDDETQQFIAAGVFFTLLGIIVVRIATCGKNGRPQC